MASHLEVQCHSGAQLVALDTVTFSVGRVAGNDIVLDDDRVSRIHAILERRGGGWCVRDLASRNGTFVNGEQIVTERALHDRDEIRMGASVLLYRADRHGAEYPETRAAEPPPPLTPRERDVLLALFRPRVRTEMLTEPATTREIAEALCVTEAAVKQHLINLYAKFSIPSGVRSRRLRLANEAVRRGAVKLAEIRRLTQ